MKKVICFTYPAESLRKLHMAHKFSIKIFLVFFIFLFLPSHLVWGQYDRETWQPPEQIMDSIGVKPGMIIGEAGAGQGYFTFYLARRVGEKGKVFANDISKSSLHEIQSRSKRENITNIITVSGETEDPLFPQKNIDMIVMVYVLHEMEKPVEFMGNLQKYIKPETLLVIIERKTNTNSSHYPAFMTKKKYQI